MRSATSLEGPARTLVHRLKYHGWGGLGRVMALQMAPALPEGVVDFLVPVPTTVGRRRLRGYNQARRIALELSRLSHIPVADALVRRPFGRTQLALQPHQRLANVQRAFLPRVAGDSSMRDARVILVDDVLTTGSTMCAAAGVLREAGVGSISVLTFARALPARRALS